MLLAPPFVRSTPSVLAVLLLLAGLVSLAPSAALAQTVPYVESFETDGEGTRYNSQAFDGGANAYFKRTDGSDIDVSNPDGYTGVLGSSFWAAEYNDGPASNGSLIKVLQLPVIDVSSAGLVRVSADFAVGCANLCLDGPFTSGEDELRIDYREAGETLFTTALQFAGTSDAPDVDFAPDTDGDGFGDGQVLTNDLQTYSFVLPASAQSVEVRIWVEVGQNEEIAFDNIRLEEIAPVGVPFAEDFETDGNGTTYFPTLEFSDDPTLATEYFKRTDGSDITVESGAYTGLSGSFFWAGADLDGGAGLDREDLKSLTLPEIDVSGEDAVRFTGLFAAGDYTPETPDAPGSYDLNDSLVVRYSTDGGATFQRGLKFAFDPGTSGSDFNQTIALDTNFDGIGDGRTLTTSMQPFGFDLPSTASTVIIRVDMYVQNGSEQLAFDNLRVAAVVPNPIQLVRPIEDQSVRRLRTTAIRDANRVFDDQNGDRLSLSVSVADPTIVRADLVNADRWIELEGLQLGSTVVTLTAQNANGDTNSTDFNVAVTTSGPLLEVDVRLAPAAEVCGDPSNIGTCSDVPETGDGFGGFRRDTLVVDPGEPVAITYVVENTGTRDVTSLDVEDRERGLILSGETLAAGTSRVTTQVFDTDIRPSDIQSFMLASAVATDNVRSSFYDAYRVEAPAPQVSIDVLLEEATLACTDPANVSTCSDLSTDGPTPTGLRSDTVNVAINQPVLVDYVVINSGQTTLTNAEIQRYTIDSGGNALDFSIPVSLTSLAPGDSVRVKRIESAPSTLQAVPDPWFAIAVGSDAQGNGTPSIDLGPPLDVAAINTPEPAATLNALIGVASEFCTDDTDLAECSDLPRTGPTPTGERRDTIDVVGGDRVYTQIVITNTGRTRLTELDVDDVGGDGFPSPIVSELAVDIAPGDSVVIERLYDLPASEGVIFLAPRLTARDASGTETPRGIWDVLAMFAAPSRIDINALIGEAASFCPDVTNISTCTAIPRSGSRPSDGGRVDTILVNPNEPVLVQYVVSNPSTTTLESLTIEDSGQDTIASEPALNLAPGGEYVASAIFDAPGEVQDRPYVFVTIATAVNNNADTLRSAEAYGFRIPNPEVAMEALIGSAGEFCTDLADINTCSDIPNTGSGPEGVRSDTIDVYSAEPVYIQYRVVNTGRQDLTSIEIVDVDRTVYVSQTGLTLAPGEEIVLAERLDGPTAADLRFGRIVTYPRFAVGTDTAGNRSRLRSESLDVTGARLEQPRATINALIGDALEFCTDVTEITSCSDIPTGGSTPTGARRDTLEALPSGAPFLVRYLVENTGTVDITNISVQQLFVPTFDTTTVVPVGSIPDLAPGESASANVLFGSETTPGLTIYSARLRGQDRSGPASERTVSFNTFGVQTEGPAFRTTTLSGPAAVFCATPTDPTTCSLERQKRATDPAAVAKSGSDAQAVRYAFYNDGTVDFVSHSLLDNVTGVVFSDRVETVAPLDSLVIFRIGDEVAGVGEARVATWTAVSSDGETFTNSTAEAPLPVELVQFVPQVSGRNVVLAWKTASEENNAGFAVLQRTMPGTSGSGMVEADASAADGSDWRQIGFVDGAGTTSDAQSYRFDLGALSPGEYQFRLRQMDVDGRAALSHEVTVQISIDGPYRLTPPAPHPIRSISTLSLITQSSQPVRVDLYDVLGRRVATLFKGEMTGGREQEIQLDSDGLANGVYFVRVVGEHFRATERVTVVR